MKAKIEFQFQLPEEQEEFDDVRQGGYYKSQLLAIHQVIRDKLKYGSLPDDIANVLREIREIITL